MLLMSVLAALWLVYALIYVSSSLQTYEFDPPNSSGAFMGIYTHYSKFFYFIFVFGLVGGFASLGYIRDDARPGGMLLAAAIYAFLFNGFTAFFYEGYLHVRYLTGKSNYTRARYAFVQSLGWTSIILFVLGTVLCYLMI